MSEKTDIALVMGVLGVGAMPLLLADTLGLFKQQGLNVAVLSAPTGTAAVLRAVLGGRADVGLGNYDDTIQTQVQGPELQAVVLTDTLPGIVLAVRSELADRVKSAADFKGLRVGVPLLGSAGEAMVRTMLQQAGVAGTDVVVNYDPAMTILERLGKIRVLTDTRTQSGCIAAYGGLYPSLCLYGQRAFIDRHPVATQRLTNALVGGLRYLHSRTGADALDAIAPKYRLGDRTLALAVLEKSRQRFSRNGRFDPAALQTPLRVMSVFDSKIAAAQIDLSRTFTNAFVAAVPPPV